MTILGVPARVTTSPSAAPVEVVTPIKASEAIRLGCLLAPVQLFAGPYVDYQTKVGACAFGAMALGQVGWGDDDLGHEAARRASRLHAEHPERPCPVSGCDDDGGDLAHLNDDHRWSRERIADWLEGLGL